VLAPAADRERGFPGRLGGHWGRCAAARGVYPRAQPGLQADVTHGL